MLRWFTRHLFPPRPRVQAATRPTGTLRGRPGGAEPVWGLSRTGQRSRVIPCQPALPGREVESARATGPQADGGRASTFRTLPQHGSYAETYSRFIRTFHNGSFAP